MKKYIFHTLFASAAIFFAGCADEIEQFTPKRSGDEIVFGGRATYELSENKNQKAPATRTVYTGTFLGADGQTWTSGTKYEVIHWESGDKVRIYSAEAAGTTVADYTVNVNDEDATGAAELSKIGAAGLQWSDETSYDFYAVYPSPHQYPLKDGELDSDVNEAVLNNSKTILGRIPTVQECKGTPVKDGTSWILTPQMEYAYMVAHQKVEDAQKTGAEIYLNFVPIATAVEIELVNKSERTLELTNILVSSATGDAAFTGDFTADLSALTIGNEENIYTGIPAENFITNTSNTGSQISIPTYQGLNGLVGDPIALEDGESIKFTLFMLPNQDIDDLKITLVGIEGNRVGTTNGITITKHKKTFLNQMPISIKQGDYDQSSWIEFLPDNAYIKGLSIPGAGGASSGNVYASSSATIQNYLEQSLSIEDLWRQGIRCFEFTVDKATSGSLGSVEVYCNRQETNLTLDECVTKVKTLLGDNPDEFAMVIITYQQQSGWDLRDENSGAMTSSRSSTTFMSQLNTYWTNLTMPTGTQKALYSGDLTIGDARGSLFCIARPTSNGEDNFATIATDDYSVFLQGDFYELTGTTYATSITTPVVSDPNILVVHGWGALKDKWYARGFTECIYHRGNGWSSFQSGLTNGYSEKMGYNANRPGRPFDVASSSSDAFTSLSSGTYYSKLNTDTAKTTHLGLTSNFFYSTVTNNGGLTQNGVWAQEWARVSPETETYTISNNSYAKWIESMTEKKKHVEECLDYSLNRTKGDIIYINSLCGYYITSDVPLSLYANSLTDFNVYWHEMITQSNKLRVQRLTAMSNEAGMCGNIAGFATDINDYFYNLLQDVTTNPDFVPGPMGIILMDRVSSNKEENGSKIPSIIIANNFQHTLPSAPATLSLPRADLEEGDVVAAPKRRNASEESGEMTIVWE